MGWAIFQQALRMVVNNFAFLARTTVPIWAVFVGLMLLVFGQTVNMPGPDGMNGSINVVPAIVSMLGYIIATTWIAIIWHRYVLLEERPTGLVPPFDMGLVVQYFIVGLVNALCLFLPLIVVGVVLGLIGALLPFGAVIGFALTALFAQWIWFRLSLRLPAAALGKRIGIKESWEATAPHSKDLLILAAILAGALVVYSAVTSLLSFGGAGVLGLVDVFFQWLALVFSVSVLTAIYGVIVEKRPI